MCRPVRPAVLADDHGGTALLVRHEARVLDHVGRALAERQLRATAGGVVVLQLLLPAVLAGRGRRGRIGAVGLCPPPGMPSHALVAVVPVHEVVAHDRGHVGRSDRRPWDWAAWVARHFGVQVGRHAAVVHLLQHQLDPYHFEHLEADAFSRQHRAALSALFEDPLPFAATACFRRLRVSRTPHSRRGRGLHARGALAWRGGRRRGFVLLEDAVPVLRGVQRPVEPEAALGLPAATVRRVQVDGERQGLCTELFHRGFFGAARHVASVRLDHVCQGTPRPVLELAHNLGVHGHGFGEASVLGRVGGRHHRDRPRPSGAQYVPEFGVQGRLLRPHSRDGVGDRRVWRGRAREYGLQHGAQGRRRRVVVEGSGPGHELVVAGISVGVVAVQAHARRRQTGGHSSMVGLVAWGEGHEGLAAVDPRRDFLELLADLVGGRRRHPGRRVLRVLVRLGLILVLVRLGLILVLVRRRW